MSAEEAANYTGLSASYLAKLRMGVEPQVGPRFLRIGRRAIRYRRVDLDGWMNSMASGEVTTGGGPGR